jgi:hypothetical protein
MTTYFYWCQDILKNPAAVTFQKVQDFKMTTSMKKGHLNLSLNSSDSLLMARCAWSQNTYGVPASFSKIAPKK